MPWDFGAGDIIAGIRLAVAIYEFGFVEENAAGKRLIEINSKCYGDFALYTLRRIELTMFLRNRCTLHNFP